MTSSTSYRRTLVWFITIFFITQVFPQCNRPNLRGFIDPCCCPRASDALIREPVHTCFEQQENTSDRCKIHAYILMTKDNAFCVDPRAWWLPNRLKKLERRGIYCKMLMGPGQTS